MESSPTGKIIALSVDPKTALSLQRIAVPGFSITTTRTAVEALLAVQAAGPMPVVLFAEHADAPVPHSSETAPSAEPSAGGPSEAATLLAAAKMRCPQVRRIMLVRADLLPWMIRLIHAGAVDALVALPLSDQELISAVGPLAWHERKCANVQAPKATSVPVAA